MRSKNPFTARQISFIEAIRKKLCQTNDPDPEIITDEAFEFYIEQTKNFGKIPKIRFKPHACRIKAEIIKTAGLFNETRENEKARIRQIDGFRSSRNCMARLFESEWNNIMLKAKKSMITIGHINHLFTSEKQNLSDPVRLLQQIVFEEYKPILKTKIKPLYSKEEDIPAEKQNLEGIKPYDQELAELE